MEERYTNIRLVKVPLEIDDKNQLDFSSATTQYNYFNSCDYIELDDSSYQRKDNTCRYPGHIDDLIGYNYCMYKNTTYNDKWFYAFITDMQYINDSMTLVSIKTDVWQTWQFDINYKKCFIEREHVNDDTLGANLIPENLETGEYIVNYHGSDSYNNDITVVTGSTVGPSDYENYSMCVYNAIPVPMVYCRWDTLSDLATFLNNLNSVGKIEALKTMFFCPKWLCPKAVGTVYVTESTTVGSQTLGISPITTLDGYTPVNKKLLTYPYCYIALSNAMGQYNVYHQELWTPSTQVGDLNGQLLVDMIGVLTPSCSIRAIPKGYKGDGVNWDESITIGKFPQLAWSNDIYTNWLTQNGVNIAGIRLNAYEAGLIGGGLQTALGVGSVVAGNPYGIGAALGGISDIANSVQTNYRHSIQPNGVEGSLNTGDVSTVAGGNRLHFYRVTISSHFASIIDNFFSMFGYKVNSVKTPNITGRTNWNYVKTIDCNIYGSIPQKDLIEIKNMFNAGVTFWHNPTTFLDYSQSNTIVS